MSSAKNDHRPSNPTSAAPGYQSAHPNERYASTALH